MANYKKVSLLLKFYNTVLQYFYVIIPLALFLSLFEWMSGGQDLYLPVFFNGKLKHETSIIRNQFHFIQKIKSAISIGMHTKVMLRKIGSLSLHLVVFIGPLIFPVLNYCRNPSAGGTCFFPAPYAKCRYSLQRAAVLSTIPSSWAYWS